MHDADQGRRLSAESLGQPGSLAASTFFGPLASLIAAQNNRSMTLIHAVTPGWDKLRCWQHNRHKRYRLPKDAMLALLIGSAAGEL